MKFKKGDKVKIISKSYGRSFEEIHYNHGIIKGTISNQTGRVYLINNDYFLECDLIEPDMFFTDKDFEL